MGEDKTYNGWMNHETWAVGLYLDGNYDGEGTYREVLELVSNIQNEYADSEFSPKMAIADALNDYVTESLPNFEASLASDLLGAAMSEVNWLELAESKLEEIKETV